MIRRSCEKKSILQKKRVFLPMAREHSRHGLQSNGNLIDARQIQRKILGQHPGLRAILVCDNTGIYPTKPGHSAVGLSRRISHDN